jgi:hypothetical protein
MYNVNNFGINAIEDISLESILARDSDTYEILTGGAMPQLTGLEYSADNTGTLMFDASHFTTFELAPFHELSVSLLAS